MSDDTTTPAGGTPDVPTDAPTAVVSTGDAADGGSGRRRKAWMTGLGLVVACAVGAGAAVLLTSGGSGSPNGSDALTPPGGKRVPNVSTTRPTASRTTMAAPPDSGRSTSSATRSESASSGSGGATPASGGATPTTVTTTAPLTPFITRFAVTSPGCGPSELETYLTMTFDTGNAIRVEIYVNGIRKFENAFGDNARPPTIFSTVVPCESATYNVQLLASDAAGKIAQEGGLYAMTCLDDVFGELLECHL